MSEPDILRQFFEAKAFEYAPGSAPRAVCTALVSGRTTSHDLKTILDRYGLARDRLLHCLYLDWVIEYMRYALSRGAYACDVTDDIHTLKELFSIARGDFYALRAAEVKALLCDQLEQVLEDGTLTEHEELGQRALQSAFDLSADRYLALTGRLYEGAIDDLRLAVHWATPHELPSLITRLKSLELICNVTGEHRTSIGGMH